MLATYAAQMIATIRISFADRTNFVLQMAGMAVNNGFFFLLWILFFAGFRSVGGWQVHDQMLVRSTGPRSMAEPCSWNGVIVAGRRRSPLHVAGCRGG
jgi:ABC-type uncharacterized transport system permease subunit